MTIISFIAIISGTIHCPTKVVTMTDLRNAHKTHRTKCTTARGQYSTTQRQYSAGQRNAGTGQHNAGTRHCQIEFFF